jgi:RNase P/RNase MRP subunit p29
MKATRDNIHMHEFIGRSIQIVSSSDGRWNGKFARIINETKNTFKISIEGEDKTLPKKGTILAMKLGNDNIKIDTSNLMFRPEDRIKKARRKKAVT